jgi:hypothetical protein
MKIKITEAGSESFNGWIGDVEFVNGLSVADQSEQAIAHVGAIYSTELVEDAPVKKVEDKVPAAVTKTVETPKVAVAPEAVVTTEVTTEVAETADAPEAPEAVETAEEQAETASTDEPTGE